MIQSQKLVLTIQLYGCVSETPISKHFEKYNLTPPLGLRILPLFKDSKIDLDVVDDTSVSYTLLLSQSKPPNLSVFDEI